MVSIAGVVKTHSGQVIGDESGADQIEDGLLATLIVLVVLPIVIILGPLVAALYTGVIGAF